MDSSFFTPKRKLTGSLKPSTSTTVTSKTFLRVLQMLQLLTKPSECHIVWKSLKLSHSTLRAKRARFTFWMDKKFIKNAKNSQFWRVFENATFWGIFKHRASQLTAICQIIGGEQPNAIFLNLFPFKMEPKKTQCLKIAQKVAFNIASEASYTYILKYKS